MKKLILTVAAVIALAFASAGLVAGIGVPTPAHADCGNQNC